MLALSICTFEHLKPSSMLIDFVEWVYIAIFTLSMKVNHFFDLKSTSIKIALAVTLTVYFNTKQVNLNYNNYTSPVQKRYSTLPLLGEVDGCRQ